MAEAIPGVPGSIVSCSSAILGEVTEPLHAFVMQPSSTEGEFFVGYEDDFPAGLYLVITLEASYVRSSAETPLFVNCQVGEGRQRARDSRV